MNLGLLVCANQVAKVTFLKVKKVKERSKTPTPKG